MKLIYYKNLLNKIYRRDFVVGIIGLGYVGLPLAINFSKKKINTIGFDIDGNKISNLKKFKSYFKDISNETLKEIKYYFDPTTNIKKIQKCDIIVICLPTPLKDKFKPDLKYILSTIRKIKPLVKYGQLISLESTSYPGTTEEIIANNFSDKFNIGKNLFISFSPEREDPGNKKFPAIKIPKIVSGVTNNCLKISKLFYKTIFQEVVVVKSTKTAEFTKLLENIYRSVNIALVNEMKIVAKLMGVNIYESLKAASTKPFGFKAFKPGPGMGGHCIPIDPFYLSWKAKKLGYSPKFIHSAGIINSVMPKWIVSQIMKYFKKNKIKINSKLLIIGIAYKKNIDDLRESPALEIMKYFKKNKIKFDYFDKYIPKLKSTRKFNFKMKSIKLNSINLKKYSAVVIVTDHDNIDYKFLKLNSKLIFDCRGRFGHDSNSKKIVLL